MFEKKAEEICSKYFEENCYKKNKWADTHDLVAMWQDGYNNGKKDVKHDLMMKLKDEGIVKPLKDSIFRNERLSSQEQQELCAWIECAMDYGENLDECAKELKEVNKANEWHFVKDGDLPKDEKNFQSYVVAFYGAKASFANGKPCWEELCYNTETKRWVDRDTLDDLPYVNKEGIVIAWKEIVLPELPKENE